MNTQTHLLIAALKRLKLRAHEMSPIFAPRQILNRIPTIIKALHLHYNGGGLIAQPDEGLMDFLQEEVPKLRERKDIYDVVAFVIGAHIHEATSSVEEKAVYFSNVIRFIRENILDNPGRDATASSIMSVLSALTNVEPELDHSRYINPQLSTTR